VLLLVASGAHATLVNADFEDPGLGAGSVSLEVPGWIEFEDGPQQSPPGKNSSVGIVHPGAGQLPLGTNPAGSGNLAFIQLANADPVMAGLYQTPWVVEGGAGYRVTFDVGNMDAGGAFVPDDRDADTMVHAFFTLGDDGVDFSKRVGSHFEMMLDQIPEQGMLLNRALTYAPAPEDVGQPLNIVFTAERGAGGVWWSEVWLDDVRLEAGAVEQVPEPDAWVMALLGATLLVSGIAHRRYRRRRSMRPSVEPGEA